MPNPNMLNWLHYQDIQLTDVELRQQFRTFFLSGQYQEALNLLNTHKTQLLGKAAVEDILNVIVEGINVLQSNFDINVLQFLSNLDIEYQDMISELVKKGEWLATVQYQPKNVVSYQNELYFCVNKPPIGTLPTDASFWKLLGLRGEIGYPSVDVTLEYKWQNNTTYQQKDVVIYNSNAYVALKQNVGVVPTSDPTTWILFIEIGKVRIHIGTIPPPLPVNDTIWFHTDSDPSVTTSNVPIYGYFKRYVEATSEWETMYPLTAFSWVKDFNEYRWLAKSAKQTILPTDWVDNEVRFNYTTIGPGDLVSIWPDNMSEPQYYAYNVLSISTQGNEVVLKTPKTPTVSIPIIIEVR